MFHIESLLSARLFIRPQLLGDQIIVMSNLSGRLSLYAMDYGGSVPEPLLPAHIALQNPLLIGGKSFALFPQLDKILVMIDHDGDENYQPMLIPIGGGFPQPAFEDIFHDQRVHLLQVDSNSNIVYITADSHKEQIIRAYQGDLKTGGLTLLGESPWGTKSIAFTAAHSKALIVDTYTFGDSVLYLWDKESGVRRCVYGIPMEERPTGYQTALTHFRSAAFIDEDHLLVSTALYDDSIGIAQFNLDREPTIEEIPIHGFVHMGSGELERIIHTKDETYLLQYNIDGCSWVYEAVFNAEEKVLNIKYVICGAGFLSNGVLESVEYDKEADRFILAYSTAVSPIQIFTVEGSDRSVVLRHTNERILGIKESSLSSGEDATFISFDGTRISARLYHPAPGLGYPDPRPVIYYVHGGPQSQERPDFSWFSMPLIQYLTLNGFSVFVPNVRGSIGYGLSYTKQVDRDWGGDDRLDHVHAISKVLPNDLRLDTSRVGLVGRSYGGYMTLMLAGRHPEIWKAAVDMFGPYDLITFLQRIPETWKPFYKLSLGDPESEAHRAFLVERSPSRYLHNLACPLLVVQGKNDPRVVEHESRDLITALKAENKAIDYLLFEDEGHDILKFENRIKVYQAITEFFIQHLIQE
jgi:pimeloyl-ACP methyl ester carboxylesterase